MKKKLKWILIIISLVVIAVVSYYVYIIIKFSMAIQKPPTVTTDENGTTIQIEPPEWEGNERVNILLLGGDSRSDTDKGRSDSIMVASIDPVTKQAHLYSVLRDTYTEIPGYGKRKINEAYTHGGPELSMKTVSELTGLPIHYYFFIDFESFVKLVDAIGGVEFEVEKNMYYVDKTYKQEFVINLKKGLQHLDGDKALQYVRFRFDVLSDFTRTERQREFLKAVFEKVKSTSTLINLPSILDELAPYIETNMDLGKMFKLAVLGYSVNLSELKTGQIPPMELLKESNINRQDVLLVDEVALRKYIDEELNKKNNVEENPGENDVVKEPTP